MGIPMLREKETHVGCCKEQSAILKTLDYNGIRDAPRTHFIEYA